MYMYCLHSFFFLHTLIVTYSSMDPVHVCYGNRNSKKTRGKFFRLNEALIRGYRDMGYLGKNYRDTGYVREKLTGYGIIKKEIPRYQTAKVVIF